MANAAVEGPSTAGWMDSATHPDREDCEYNSVTPIQISGVEHEVVLQMCPEGHHVNVALLLRRDGRTLSRLIDTWPGSDPDDSHWAELSTVLAPHDSEEPAVPDAVLVTDRPTPSWTKVSAWVFERDTWRRVWTREEAHIWFEGGASMRRGRYAEVRVCREPNGPDCMDRDIEETWTWDGQTIHGRPGDP